MTAAAELPDSITGAIADLVGPNGWWHESDGEEYERLAAEMLQSGIGADTVADWLTSAYAAAANEFGG